MASNDKLKAHLDELEAEFAALAGPLAQLRQEWEIVREQARPLEAKLADLEARMDAIRHGARYQELNAQLPHLRLALKR